MGFVVPPHLVITATDTEEEKSRKKKKIKILKSKFKEKQEEVEVKAVQNSWKAFMTKGVKKNVQGIRKNSMFVSPDTVEGKVGVTGSGNKLTEYGDRKRLKASGGNAVSGIE